MPPRHVMTLGFAIAAAAVLAAAPAYADKPEWAGHGNRGYSSEDWGDHGHEREYEHERHERRDREYEHERREHRFDTRHRDEIRAYYSREYRRGHCPPGLERKHDGCMPPGYARRWRAGERLPRDVARHELPPSLVVRIGVPPPGYRYVRVGTDVLMIAAGTGMIVDAINDLGR